MFMMRNQTFPRVGREECMCICVSCPLYKRQKRPHKIERREKKRKRASLLRGTKSTPSAARKKPPGAPCGQVVSPLDPATSTTVAPPPPLTPAYRRLSSPSFLAYLMCLPPPLPLTPVPRTDPVPSPSPSPAATSVSFTILTLSYPPLRSARIQNP